MENIHEVMNLIQEEEPPLFLNFPSPFFDGILSTTTTQTNNYTHQHRLTSPNKPAVNIITNPLPSEPKRFMKKRSVGKKDRHSKIHTAQGLRDRRMRLSLDIARKFFDLQDLLGFDKASETIEWLFSKSNKAIKEVAQNFSPQNIVNQSMNEESFMAELTSDNKIGINKEEEIKNKQSKKQVPNNASVRETRDQARARARDRTRERLMIKDLEKSSKQLFGGNPKEEIYKLGLGHITSPNNHNAEELGLITSSPYDLIQQESSSLSMYCSTLMNQNPPAGWLDSGNGFLSSEWNADSYVNEYYYNYGIVPTTVSLTGENICEQNPSSFLMTGRTTNILHVQSQNQANSKLQIPLQ